VITVNPWSTSRLHPTTINPDLLTAAERLQYEGYLGREEIYAAVLALAKGGMPIKQIVVRSGHGRQVVRQIIRGERHEVFRTQQSSPGGGARKRAIPSSASRQPARSHD
jgi:hypothetical protein